MPESSWNLFLPSTQIMVNVLFVLRALRARKCRSLSPQNTNRKQTKGISFFCRLIYRQKEEGGVVGIPKNTTAQPPWPRGIFGHPIGCGCATQPVWSCRGAPLMGMRAT
jgi:hypothetical protein